MKLTQKQNQLKEQALSKVAELFPEDYITYKKWEEYKKIYAAGYHTGPIQCLLTIMVCIIPSWSFR